MFAERLLRETREELQKADSKANIVLAAAGVVVGALLAGLIAGDVSLRDEPPCVWVFAIIGAVGMLAGVGLGGAAVYPRIGKPDAGRLRYFAEVCMHQDDVEALRRALDVEVAGGVARDLHQIHRLSGLVQQKYQLTQRAMWALGAGFVSAGIAALLAEVSAG